MTHQLRAIPAVSKVLEHPALAELRTKLPAASVTSAIRAELAELRLSLTSGGELLSLDVIATNAFQRLLQSSEPKLRPVINATGIILHTNLGRAPIHESAARAAYDAARGYLNLELDLRTGKRSSRQESVRAGIAAITGAESGTVVNNCAAATMAVLRTLASGKEVVVSRGQLIEIGGGFRIPEIMTAAGATLCEVGTVNITRISDYEKAVGPNTGLLMRVHTSNYRVRGFVKSVGIDELVALGLKHGIPVVDDVGSGVAIALPHFTKAGEPLVSEGIAAGADLVLFSGDKLLGGPQSGIIAGKQKLIQLIERDPFMRAIRVDKMTLAALEATLRLYQDPERAVREIPTLRAMNMTQVELLERSERFVERLRGETTLQIEIRDDVAYVGGGSLPDVALPTVVIALTDPNRSEEELAAVLRFGSPPVVGRVRDGTLLLDLRTVFTEQEDDLLHTLSAVARVR